MQFARRQMVKALPAPGQQRRIVRLRRSIHAIEPFSSDAAPAASQALDTPVR
jgi:hypothetical protein